MFKHDLLKSNPTRAQTLRNLYISFSFLLVLVYSIAIFQSWRETMHDVKSSLKYISSLLVQATRATFKSNELILRGLGSELLEQGALTKPENGRLLIERMKAIDPGMAGFGLARPDGQLVLVSGVKAGVKLPNLITNPVTSESFHKSIITKSFQTGRPYFMEQLKSWVIPIRVPLLDKDGRVTAVMTAGYSIDAGSAAWAHLQVPKDVNILLLRRDGYRLHVHPLPPGEKSLVMQTYYGAPLPPGPMEKLNSLVEDEGFDQVYAPLSKATLIFYYQMLPEYEIFVGSLIPRKTVLLLWLERSVAPTALFLVFLIGGYFAYRRSVVQLAKSDIDLEKSRKDLEQSNFNLQLINALSNRLNLKLEVDAILYEATDTLTEFAQPDAVVIDLIVERGNTITVAASHGLAHTKYPEGFTLPFAGSLTEKALQAGKPLLMDDTGGQVSSTLSKVMAELGVTTLMVIPLVYGSEPIGSIILFYRTTRHWLASQLDTLNAIGRAVSLSLANARQLRDFEYRALHDPLTGLANRILLHQQFNKMIGELGSSERVGLFLLDLDHFKEINDTLGHQVGDKLLCEIGPRFDVLLHKYNFTLARLGGDEFVVLVSGVFTNQEWLDLGRHLRQNLKMPFSLEGMMLDISASVGFALYPDQGKDSHILMRHADVAMYEAKRSGAGILLYEPGLDIHTPERLALMVELAPAIEAGQLVLHYQPKLDLAGRKISGFEALVRWQHPMLGLLYPDRFIPMAETSDAIHRLTAEVVRQALKQQQAWKAAGLNYSVAVNLSARNLVDERFLCVMEDLMQTFGVEQGDLELEITESALMHDPESALKLLHQFSDMSISLSIDDFGTGFSSMAYLRQMPVNTLKIDMLFVRDMLNNAQDAIIVNSTIGLAHNLGMKVVAEGVEDMETLRALTDMGCDLIQGYYISKPKPWDELAAWVTTFRL